MNSPARRALLGLSAASLALSVIGRTRAAPNLALRDRDALIVVDVQNCFVPGGSLAVSGGDEIVPLVNRLARRFRHVLLTQDWHTADLVSFASQHPGKKPFDSVALPSKAWADMKSAGVQRIQSSDLL